MTGVIIMIFGGLTFLAGFVIYKVSATPTPTNNESQSFLDKDMIGNPNENTATDPRAEALIDQNEELTNDSVTRLVA